MSLATTMVAASSVERKDMASEHAQRDLITEVKVLPHRLQDQ